MAVVIPTVVTSTSASGGQVIDGSLVVQSSLSQYLQRTFTAGNQKTWTFSAWIKKTSFGSSKKGLFGYDSTNDHIRLQNNDDGGDSMRFLAPSVFDYILSRKDRDSGWFHLVVSCDTTQGSASDRVNIYYNGELQTAYYSSSDPSQDADTGFNQAGAHSIGRGGTGGDQAYVDAILSNVYWIDGQQLESSEFGYTDPLTNTWRPKKYTGDFNIAAESYSTAIGVFTRYNTTPNADSTVAYLNSNPDASAYPVIQSSQVANKEIIVKFASAQNGVTSIKFRGGGYAASSTYTLFVNGTQIGGTHNTATLWAEVEHTISSTDITELKIVGSDGFALGQLKFDDSLVSGTPSYGTEATGVNSFYLSFDGNSPIGRDQSGKGNDWTPVDLGGSNSIDKATGALPILNTVNGGKVATVGVRTDPYHANLVLALPLVGNTLDVSNQINSGSTTKVATLNGDPTTSSTQSNFYSGSYYFDGVDDYLSFPGSTDLSFGTGDFTVEWMMWSDDKTANGVYNRLFCNDGPTGDSAGNLQFNIDEPTGALVIWSGAENVLLASTNLCQSEWHHVAVTRSGTTLRIFVDGAQDGSVSNSTDWGTHNSGSPRLSIGSRDGTGDYKGYLSNYLVYKGLAKYTTDFIPASTNPGILPETPSGVTYPSELAKVPVTDGAVAFGGSGAANPNKYLTVPDSADFTFGTGDFTLEAYVNYSDNTTWSSIIQKYTTDAASSSWFWGIYAGIMKMYIYYGSSQVAVAPSSTSTFPENAWVHCAVTKDGNTVRLFQNGVLIATADMTGLTMNDSSVALTIGSDGDQNYDLNGYVSNVRVIKADIPTAYQTTSTTLGTNVFTPPLAPLTDVTNTKLLCCQSNTSAIAAAVTPGTIVATGAVATNFTPFNTDLNIIRGQETAYCTLNPLNGGTKLTLTNGNLTATGATGHACAGGTIYVSGGKYYWEALMVTVSTTYSGVGMARDDYSIGIGLPGYDTDKSFIMYSSAGYVYYNSTSTVTYGTSWTTGDMIGCRYDEGYCYFYKNNVLMNASPVPAATVTSGNWTPVFQSYGDGVWDINFGQKPFRYQPPKGHQPISFATLSSGGGITTSRTEITNPSQYVGITTYQGTGAIRAVSGYNFRPDLVWVKAVNGSDNNNLIDSVRPLYMVLETNYGRDTTNYGANGVISLNSDGFTLGTDGGFNSSSYYFAAWCWKAGGNPGISTTAFWKDDKEYASAAAAGLTGDSELFLQDEVYSSVLYGYSSAHGAQFQTGAEAVKAFNGTVGSAWNQGASPLGGGSDTYIRFTPSSQVATNTVSVYINHHMDVSFYTGSPGSETKVAGPFSTSTSAYFTKVDCGTVPAWDYVQMQVDDPASYSAYLGGIEIGGKLLVDSNVSAPGVPALTPTSASIGTKPGFSIIKYRGNGTSGATISHGLSQAPDCFVIKSTEYSYNWNVYHKSMGNTHLIRMNQQTAKVTESGAAWNDTSPTSSLITFGNLGGTNMNTAEYVGYIWHDVPGLQKFGSYIGNNSADGTYVELGFRPALLIIKNADATNPWIIRDSVRDPFNSGTSAKLAPNFGYAQNNSTYIGTATQTLADFLSNGFKVRSTGGISNDSGVEYLYMAWAEQPMNNMYGAQSNAR
jgi:hypothetical protein